MFASPAVLATVLSCAGGDCSGCGPDPIAELSTLENRVERDFVAEVGAWKPASQGQRLVVGEGVRTGEASSAELELFPAGRLRVEESTTVRFQDRPPGASEPRLELEAGRVELEADAVALEVSTRAGVARVSRGSRVKVERAEQSLLMRVLVGHVRMEQATGAVEAEHGQTLSVDVGTLVVERLSGLALHEGEAGAAGDAGQGEVALDGGAKAPAVAGALRFDEPPPDVHFGLPAGESATIHDARLPASVRIEFSDCPQGGAVELARGRGAYTHQRVRGQGGATLRLERGHYRYRVRCFEGDELSPTPVARGSFVVRQDAGTRRLPRTPPAASVDVDGRRYTVRYQNLLPELTLRWPAPPAASSYELEVTSGGGRTLRRSGPGAEFRVASGVLGEGVHQIAMRAAGKTVRGSLRIAFDNTATTAYLSTPRDGQPRPGESALVAGAALRGSRVSVNGRALGLSAEGRFRAEVQVPADVDALAVRVQHAATGVHYYVRRVAR